MTTISKIKIGDTTYQLTGSPRFITCATAANVAEKIGILTNDDSLFVLETGVKVCVKFTYANTANSPTLNVNNTGAKQIHWRGADLPPTQRWTAGMIVEFIYDGTYWQAVSAIQDNNTTDYDDLSNKPFYSELTDTIVLADNVVVELVDEEGAGVGMNFGTLAFELIEGSEYIVTWDGVEYTTTCYVLEGTPFIGNGAMVGAPVGDDVPFIIFYMDGATIVASPTIIGSVTVSVIGKLYTIHKIDEKYLPRKMVGKDVSGVEFTINDEIVVAGQGAEVFNDISINIASGENSHAEGYSTIASGNSSHAEGSGTTASGNYSHAEGDWTKAEGNYSHAEGVHTTASGAYSHAEGGWTTASGYYQHVQGQYNISDTISAHIVGNGDTTTPSNAHTLDWDGNAWFAGDVHIKSTSGTNKDEGSKKLATEEFVINNSITTSGSGSAYTATINGIASLGVGMKITIIPHTTSTTTTPTFNLNNLGAKYIRMPVTYNTSANSGGAIDEWLIANKPVVLEYDGEYWKTISMPRPAAQYLYGAVQVQNGGTGLEELTAGSYLVGNGTGSVVLKTPAEVAADIIANILPPVTAEDNGKVLCVVDGEWKAVTIPLAEEATFGG